MKTITVTISGEQGVGKSTLARILMNAISNSAVVESQEHIPFYRLEDEELESWAQRLFADVKIVFKTEQTQTEPIK